MEGRVGSSYVYVWQTGLRILGADHAFDARSESLSGRPACRMDPKETKVKRSTCREECRLRFPQAENSDTGRTGGPEMGWDLGPLLQCYT